LKHLKFGVLLVLFVFALANVYGDTVLDFNKAIGLLKTGLEFDDPAIIQQAVNLFEKLAVKETDPERLREIRISLGDSYYALREYEKAKKNYEAALELTDQKDERYLYTIYSLVFCSQNLDQVEEAAKYARELFGTSYEDDVRYAVGSMYFSNQLYEESIEFLHSIGESFQMYHSAKLMEGYALYKLKRYNEALTTLSVASKAPKGTDTWRKAVYYAALSASQLGNHEHAAQLLETLCSSENLGELAYAASTALGNEYLTLENFEGALKAFQEALKTAPTSEKSSVIDNIAWCQYKLERFAEAGNSWIESARIETDFEEKARKFHNAISSFLKKAAYEEALKTCDEAAVTMKDRSEEFLLRKGTILLDLNRAEDAKNVLEKLKSPEAAYWLAVAYLRLSQFDAAQEAVSKAKSGGYDSVKVARLESNIYLNQDKKGEALKTLLAILPKAENEKPYIRLDLGMVYLAMEKYVEAVEQLSKAYFEGPEEVKLEAAYHLGIAYESIKQWQRAADWYDKAIQVDKSEKYGTELLFKKELSLLKAKEYTKVIDELAKYEGLEPRLKYVLGEAYLNISKFDEAYATVKDILASTDDEKLKEFDPMVASGMLYIAGKYHEVKGNTGKAEEYYRKLVELFPQSAKAPWALLDAGLLLYRTREYERSKITLALLLASYPDFSKNDVVLYYLGLIYEKSREFDKALKVYQRLVKEYPNSSKLAEVKERIERLNQ